MRSIGYPMGKFQNCPAVIDSEYPEDKMGSMLLSIWLSGRRGRGAALARHLKIPQSLVAAMAAGEKRVPLDHCPFIQDFTDGEVTCEELRPDQTAYFALIRQQASSVVAAPNSRPVDGAPGGVERRDPNRVSQYDGTDIDRRMPAGS
jgi:DNA-binding transcriptional regulator YdaS (Cro superfamily)